MNKEYRATKSEWRYIVGRHSATWEIVQLNSGSWVIVTDVSTDSSGRHKHTYQHLNLSKNKLINRIQRYFLKTILNPNVLIEKK